MNESNFLPATRRSLLRAGISLPAWPALAADLSDSHIIQQRLEIRETAHNALAALFEIAPSAPSNFVNVGWAFAANAQLSAAVQSSGGSFAGAVSVTAGGAKFFKDTDLN